MSKENAIRKINFVDGLDFSGLSLLGKHIKTNLGNSGIVIKEWLCYPEPCEWVLDTGYVLNEAQMYSQNEEILEVLDIPQLKEVNFCQDCGQRLDWRKENEKKEKRENE